MEHYTGVWVAAKTQQRLVQRQTFEPPQANAEVEELSIDGGKVRLRSPKEHSCIWRDYKAVCLHQQPIMTSFQDNEQLVEWVNQQALATPVTCLGDGHSGVWNLIAQVASASQQREILDWYHWVENLYKVGGSLNRLQQAKAFLWRGQIDAAMVLFQDYRRKQADNFCIYLHKHRQRIVNYEYFQQEQICSIGSGAVESAIKQIDRRLKISGAQWNPENVPQVLAQRCAYLNGMLSV